MIQVDRAANVRVEVIRKLECYQPTTVYDGETPIWQTSEGLEYGRKKVDNLLSDTFFHYPILIDPDGTPWHLANRYILSRLSQFTAPSPRTLESIASDLANFRRWILEENVDFLDIPKRVGLRPTYRFCSYLHDLILFNQIKPNTAKRRMSTVQNFYRWLEQDGLHIPYELWIESSLDVNFKGQKGLLHKKQVKSTDLTRSFKSIQQSSDYSEYIDDGGKLRPLSEDEQIAVIEALKYIGNTEMTLAFLIALTTGARLQTVFTIREIQVLEPPRDDVASIRIKVGRGTLVNTKYNKQIVLLVPNWLYSRLQIYCRSPRRMDRVSKSPHVYPDPKEQYLFLTRFGQPYYMAKDDPFISLYRSPPRGNAVTQFIHQQLLPELHRREHYFSFIFHYLRASFGMNLVETILESFSLKEVPDERQPEFFKALMYVRERMGHSSLRTTEAYLNYRKRINLASKIQSDFEVFLKNIIEG